MQNYRLLCSPLPALGKQSGRIHYRSGRDWVPRFFPCLQAAVQNLGIQEALSPIFGRHPGGARISESGAIKDKLLIFREQGFPSFQN